MNDPQLIGREGALDAIWRLLETKSMQLTGPRRVGKTSVMREMRRSPRPGWRVLLLDLQGAKTTEDLADRWADQLPGEVATELGLRQAGVAGAQKAVGVELAGPGSPWRRIGAMVSAHLQWMGPDERLVVAIDEVPWWLDGLDAGEGEGAARGALAELRRLRHQWLDRVRMVVSGSVGLSGLAADLGASAELNDLFVWRLPALDRAAGSTLFEVEVVGQGGQVIDNAGAEAWKLSGGLPYWVKELAERAVSAARGGPVGLEAVDAAVEAVLQPAMRHLFRDEAREHFLRREPAHVRTLTAMLAEAAASDTNDEEGLLTAALAGSAGLSRGEARELLYRLGDAWYLQPAEGGGWAWVNPLLRLWWQRYGGEA